MSTDKAITIEAPPSDERKRIALKHDKKIICASSIPNHIMQDEFLNSLINSGLPRNYNFEVHKTIWKIEQLSAKRVLLQLPEGLIRFGPILVDIMTAFFTQNGEMGVTFITMGDLTYGACCIDDYLASSMDCDLVVHYAHSCLVPINKLTKDVKFLYIFLEIKFDLDHIVSCVKHNFDPLKNTIALASTIQFVSSVHQVARNLRQQGFTVVTPQSKPLSSGEILGCTAPKLAPEINTILFICDGRFHLEALMIANPGLDTYRYDPYSRKLTQETYDTAVMYNQRAAAIQKTIQVIENGGRIGFILGTLGRQGSERVFDSLVDKLKRHTDCSYVKIMMPEVVQDSLRSFKSVEVWVQVACPRLSIDWGAAFETPLLNPYEFARSIKLHTQHISERPANLIQSYPMDFYAKDSCGDHTPNHNCQNNPNCTC